MAIGLVYRIIIIFLLLSGTALADSTTVLSATSDWYIKSNDAYTNFGSAESLYVYWNAMFTTYMFAGFAFSVTAVNDTVPDTAIIDSCMLHVYKSTSESATMKTAAIPRDVVESEVTYNVWKTSCNWGLGGALQGAGCGSSWYTTCGSGTDRMAPYDTTTITTDIGWKYIEVDTCRLNYERANSDSIIYIKLWHENDFTGFWFYSSEHATNTPELILYWHIPTSEENIINQFRNGAIRAGNDDALIVRPK